MCQRSQGILQQVPSPMPPLYSTLILFSVKVAGVSLCEASWLGYSYRVVSAMVELLTQEVAM